MILSARLEKVASLVSPGLVLADVGTDHAYLPIYLAEKGGCPAAFAMDIRKGPLMRAQANIRAHGLQEYITVRQSDGLNALRPGEAQSIVIAGMGGPLICQILQNSPETAAAARELILAPQSEQGLVRHFLHDHGYEIDAECMTEDAGKYYQILRAIKTRPDVHAPLKQMREEDFRYGKLLIDGGDPVLEAYLGIQIRKTGELLKQLESQQSPRALARARELTQDRQYMEAALARIRKIQKR